MLLTHGFDAISTTLNELSTLFRAQPVTAEHTSQTTRLRPHFQAFLAGCQPRIPRVAGTYPTAVTSGNTWSDLVGVLREDTIYAHISTRPPATGNRVAALCFETIADLAQQTPHFDSLFEATVDALVFADADQLLGGTTQHALGVLWVNTNVPWTASMMREFLVQQFTHILLDIDDYRHGHACPTAANNRGALTHSAANHSALRAVHSTITASEILTLRARITGEPTPAVVVPPTPQLAASTLNTTTSLLRTPESSAMLSPRAFSLLETAQKAIQQAITPRTISVPDDLVTSTSPSLATPTPDWATTPH